jgi:hypothetical protein
LIGSGAAELRDIDPMDWLFELSAACVLVAVALPFAWKLLPPKPVLQPARVRTPKLPTDQDLSA